MKWKELLILLFLLLGGFGVRLYRFNNPVADWHSWRQADTSAVSRNFVKYGYDVLHPRFDDLSNVPSGKDNPQGYRFVEFPFYNIAQAGLFQLFERLTLEEWGRMVTILVSLGSTLFIYLLGRKYIGRIGAIAAAGFFAFDPYSIYYSRVILPDPSTVLATLGTIYFADLFLSSTSKKRFLWFAIALLCGACALLLKPFAAFFFLPIVYLVFKKWGLRAFYNPYALGFVVLVGIPLLLWRFWMRAYPEGIPANDWLFNGGNIRFTGAYFYWIFAERLGKLILGYWGLPLVVMGLLSKKKHYFFFLSLLISALLYLVVIARGNVQHDYYQILIIPAVAFLFGLGVDFLFSTPKEYINKSAAWAVVGICSLGMLVFGWYFIRDYFNINNRAIVTAGMAVNKLTPSQAKVIAPYDGDTSFLYQTNRQGWASFEKDLPIMIHMGADYLVLVNPTPNDFNGFGKHYQIVASSPEYLIVNLHKPL